MKLGAAGLVFFAALFLAVAVFAGGGEGDTPAAADSRPTVLGVSTAPAVFEPTRTTGPGASTVTSSVSATPAPAVATSGPVFPTSAVSQQPTPTALSTAATPAVATNPPVTGGSVTTTPVATTPAPAGALTPAAAELVSDIESEFGVRVIVSGQDWGSDEPRQLRNLGAVQTALRSMPDGVVAAIVAGPGGALSFLSNNHGSTEDGWQPYGDRAANFYSNEDRGTGGGHQANQIVLQPGSTAQTIAHEMAHAYQMRSVGMGEYVDALLTPELKSFMAATGWTQLVSDDEIRNSTDQSWATINEMFAYNGRTLSYINEFGLSVSLYTPNPIEAYAEAAGLYYARSAGTSLPKWSEYWDWFDANLG
jgi:hypothetical protein